MLNYSDSMVEFTALVKKMAVAYAGYATLFTLLPNLVTTLVLFYGGELVLVGKLRPGQLVSFMLYQLSLSSSFQTIGCVLLERERGSINSDVIDYGWRIILFRNIYM